MNKFSTLLTLAIVFVCSFGASAQSEGQLRALDKVAYKLEMKLKNSEITQSQYESELATAKQAALKGQLEEVALPKPLKPYSACNKKSNNLSDNAKAERKRELIRQFEAHKISKAQMETALANLNRQ